MLILIISLICLGIMSISIVKNNDATTSAIIFGFIGAILFFIYMRVII